METQLVQSSMSTILDLSDAYAVQLRPEAR